MKIEELIEILKDITRYDKETKTHYMIGKDDDILTNPQMRVICSHYFKDEYDDKSTKQQRLIRERIFEELK